jgi:hypothetical protein
MFKPAVTVNLSGTIDQIRLDALRSALNLHPEGRLGDAWDQIQGRRVDEVPGGRIQILLYRFDVPGPWEFHLGIESDPSVDALRAVEEQVVAAAHATGLTVADVSRRR